jgi:hypothetical protein
VRPQNRKKFFPRAIGMSNGEDGERVLANFYHRVVALTRLAFSVCSGNVGCQSWVFWRSGNVF